MADLSYTVEVSGAEKLVPLAEGITAVATALSNGKDIAQKLAAFKAAMGGMGGSLDGLKGLEEKLDSFKKTLSSKLDGLAETVKNELKTVQSTIATSVGGISAEFEKIGKAASAGLDKSGEAIKISGERNLKLNVKYATDIETAVRQIQEKGTSAMLQNLQTRASNIQRILQSEAKDAVAIAQKTYGTDFVAVMQEGLSKQFSMLTNHGQATIRLQRTQDEQMIAEGRKAAAELANIQAQAQVKAATLNPMGNYSSMKSGREFQIKNAQLFMNMPSKADFEAATAIAVQEAREAQAKAIMQVRAATNNPVGAFQRYNSSTQTAGALIGANSTNALTGSVSAAIPKAQDVEKVKQLSTAFQKLTVDGNDVHSTMRGLASGFDLLWLTWGNLLPLFAGAAISNGFMKTAKEGLAVTQTLGTIAYLGENTAAEMQSLTSELVNMGKNGVYGPIAIAEAMQTLSLAGLKANEILAVTGTVMEFSVAGATDIKTAADVLVSVTTAFGTGAAGFSRSADIIMRAAADSKASVESFGEAMKTASVVGEQYGAKQEDVALLIQYLANLGIQGSAAGTAVRNMYADISGKSGPARKAMKELGLDFRDAEGHVIGLKEQTDQLVGVLSKYDGKSQANIIQAIYGERGAKAAIELLVKAKTYILENGKLTSQLEIDQRKLENAYGDAAIAAIKMGTTTQNAFKAAGATLETTLFGAFTAMEPQLYAVAVALREAFGSKDLQDTLAKLVSGVADIAKYVAENIQTIVSAGLAYGAYKLAVVAVTVAYGAYQNILVALETVKAINLARTTAQAAAELELGAALGVRTAAEVNAAKAAATGAAARVGSLTVMGSLAKAIPFVGTAITLAGLAWMGYDMWASRSGSTMDDLSGQKSKDMITALQKENDHLEAVNEARERGLSLLEAEALVKANNAKSDVAMGGMQKMAAIQAELDNLKNQKDKADSQYGAYGANDTPHEIQVLDLQLARKRVEMRQAAEAERKLQADLAQEEQRRSDNAIHVAVLNTADREKEAAATKKLMDQYRKLYGTGSQTWEQSQGGANSHTQNPRSYDEKTLPNLQKQMDSELSVIKARFDSEKAIQDSGYKNLVITKGQYQAQLLASTVTYEQDSLASIQAHATAYVNAYVEQYAEIKKIRDGFTPDSENWKTENAKLEALRNKATTDLQADQDKIEKIKLDSNKRQLLAAQELAGETNKLIKADDEYWAKSKLATDKVEAMQKVAEQYRNINTSVLSNATALKAEAEAIAESTAQHEGQLQNMRKEIALRVDAITALEAQIELEKERATYTGNNAVWQELSNARGLNEEELAKLKAQYAKGVAEGITDGARRGSLAYQKEMEAKAGAITDSIAGAIETAIFTSGKEGGKALRDYLQAELIRKPLMAVIKAIIQPISSLLVNSVMGGGGGGGGSTLSSLGGLNGSITSAIGKGFTTFASSSVGQSLGLSETVADEGAGHVALTSTGSKIGAGLGMLGNGLAGYGISSAISGGYSLGGGNTVNIIAGIASAFFGPIAGVIGGLINRAFGKKLDDTGVQGTFGGTEGFQGENYQYYKGGWFVSDSTKTSEMDPALKKTLSDSFKAMQAQVGTFATVLGLSTDKIAGFTTTMKVSLMGLSQEDATTKIQEALATANNELAQQVIGTWKTTTEEVTSQVQNTAAEMEAGADAFSYVTKSVTKSTYVASEYAKDGEKAIDTLTRLATSLTTVNGIWDTLGYKLLETSLAGGDAASKMADAFGGLDKMVAATSSYYQNFYSADEQKATAQRQLAASLADAGVVMPDINAANARDQYRALVEKAQQDNTDAGRKLYATLITLSPAFAALTTSAEDAAAAVKKAAADAIDKAYSALQAAITAENTILEAQKSTAQDLVNSWQEIYDAAKSGAEDLFGSVSSTAAAAAARGMIFIENAVTSSQAGIIPDKEQFSTAISDAKSGMVSENYATQFELDRDRLVVANQLSKIQAAAADQMTTAELTVDRLEQQIKQNKDILDYWKQQIDIANGTYEATVSVESAIATLTKLMFPAKTPAGSGATGGASFGGGGGAAASAAPAKYSTPFSAGTAGVGYTAVTDPTAIAKLDALAPIYHGFDGTGDLKGLLEAIKAAGGSLADLSALSGNYTSDWIKAAASVGIPAFAKGTNYVPEDMLAVIHKGEAIIPEAYNPGNTTTTASTSLEWEAIMQQLAADISDIRASNKQLAEQFDKVTAGGNAILTEAA